MPLHTTLPDAIQEVDIIICGGGTAACVLAGRLSSLSSPPSILVLETGPNNASLPSVIHPALCTRNIAPGSTTAHFYTQLHPSGPELAGRSPVVPAGGVLGGGSSINFQVYTRAQRDDLNDFGMEGWDAEQLLGYMKNLETYSGPGSTQVHGENGPVHVSRGPYEGGKRAEDDLIRAAEKVGYPEVSDLQNLDANDGVERWMRYVSPAGRRSDAANAFLHPKLNDGEVYPGLHVLVETTVVRVLFEDSDDGGKEKRASAVEFIPNPAFQPALATSPVIPRVVKAREMVIISSGALGTPAVLERSGVGDPAILARAGIDVVSALPGVGANYQDHHLCLYPYRTALHPHETLDGVLAGRVDVDGAIAREDPLMGWNGFDVMAKLRPSAGEVSKMSGAVQKSWQRDFARRPNRPWMLMGLFSGFLGDPAAVPEGQYLTMATYTAYPYSRGHMHVTGPSPTDPLDFKTGFLTDLGDVDLAASVWAYKKQREMMRRMDTYRGEVKAFHPRFAEGSKAECVEMEAGEEYCGEDVREDIVYSEEDDRRIEEWVREVLGTTWHSLGTAKMGPCEDEDAVVDANLSVYGVRGLKVADLSVAPVNVGANTNNTALMIGEKAADLVKKELGLL